MRPRTAELVEQGPTDVITMDVVELVAPRGPEKVRTIHITLVATNFPEAFPGGDQATGKVAAGSLSEWSAIFGGRPKRSATDQGLEFINRWVADCGPSKGITHFIALAYTLASNGLLEIRNGSRRRTSFTNYPTRYN